MGVAQTDTRRIPLRISTIRQKHINKIAPLDLNQLMRYGFAGGNFVLLFCVSFPDAVSNRLKYIGAIGGASGVLTTAALLAATLLIGSVVYVVHRALPFQLATKILAILTRDGTNVVDLDIDRWKNTKEKKSLQRDMKEWAAQVHFLYCLTWSTALVLLVGWWGSLTSSRWQPICWWLFHLYLFSAIVHHCRYHVWERRVFDEDNGA